MGGEVCLDCQHELGGFQHGLVGKRCHLDTELGLFQLQGDSSLLQHRAQ